MKDVLKLIRKLIETDEMEKADNLLTKLLNLATEKDINANLEEITNIGSYLAMLKSK